MNDDLWNADDVFVGEDDGHASWKQGEWGPAPPPPPRGSSSVHKPGQQAVSTGYSCQAPGESQPAQAQTNDVDDHRRVDPSEVPAPATAAVGSEFSFACHACGAKRASATAECPKHPTCSWKPDNSPLASAASTTAPPNPLPLQEAQPPPFINKHNISAALEFALEVFHSQVRFADMQTNTLAAFITSVSKPRQPTLARCLGLMHQAFTALRRGLYQLHWQNAIDVARLQEDSTERAGLLLDHAARIQQFRGLVLRDKAVVEDAVAFAAEHYQLEYAVRQAFNDLVSLTNECVAWVDGGLQPYEEAPEDDDARGPAQAMQSGPVVANPSIARESASQMERRRLPSPKSPPAGAHSSQDVAVAPTTAPRDATSAALAGSAAVGKACLVPARTASARQSSRLASRRSDAPLPLKAAPSTKKASPARPRSADPRLGRGPPLLKDRPPLDKPRGSSRGRSPPSPQASTRVTELTCPSPLLRPREAGETADTVERKWISSPSAEDLGIGFCTPPAPFPIQPSTVASDVAHLQREQRRPRNETGATRSLLEPRTQVPPQDTDAAMHVTAPQLMPFETRPPPKCGVIPEYPRQPFPCAVCRLISSDHVRCSGRCNRDLCLLHLRSDLRNGRLICGPCLGLHGDWLDVQDPGIRREIGNLRRMDPEVLGPEVLATQGTPLPHAPAASSPAVETSSSVGTSMRGADEAPVATVLRQRTFDMSQKETAQMHVDAMKVLMPPWCPSMAMSVNKGVAHQFVSESENFPDGTSSAAQQRERVMDGVRLAPEPNINEFNSVLQQPAENQEKWISHILSIWAATREARLRQKREAMRAELAVLDGILSRRDEGPPPVTAATRDTDNDGTDTLVVHTPSGQVLVKPDDPLYYETKRMIEKAKSEDAGRPASSLAPAGQEGTRDTRTREETLQAAQGAFTSLRGTSNVIGAEMQTMVQECEMRSASNGGSLVHPTGVAVASEVEPTQTTSTAGTSQKAESDGTTALCSVTLDDPAIIGASTVARCLTEGRADEQLR